MSNRRDIGQDVEARLEKAGTTFRASDDLWQAITVGQPKLKANELDLL